MSEFDDARQKLTEELLDVFGVDAVYTFADMSTQNLVVRFYEDLEVLSVEDGDIRRLDKAVGISVSDIALPVREETLVIDGQTYVIGRRQEQRGRLGIYPISLQ